MKPFAGSPLRPKNQGCQGQSVATHGTSFSSHWSDTGFAVSGVLPATMRSILSLRMRSAAISPARLALDWLSLVTISTSTLRPPMVSPLFSVCWIAPITNLFASPNGASGPVAG